MIGKASASRLFAIALAGLVTLAAAPAPAQEAEEARARKETCLEVGFDGDYKFKIPCPPGIRPLLEQLPRPAEPAPRRGIVIDPQWPHDQAMAAEHDWPYDSAMIAPHADEGDETAPLFGELLGLFEEYLSGYSEDQSTGGWYFGDDFNEATTEELGKPAEPTE